MGRKGRKARHRRPGPGGQPSVSLFNGTAPISLVRGSGPRPFCAHQAAETRRTDSSWPASSPSMTVRRTDRCHDYLLRHGRPVAF